MHSFFERPIRARPDAEAILPDFIVQIGDRHQHLIADIKGCRGQNAKEKATMMDAYWVPVVNASKINA
jgi:type III restriction enzyme